MVATPAVRITPCRSPAAIAIVPNARGTRPNNGSRRNVGVSVPPPRPDLIQTVQGSVTDRLVKIVFREPVKNGLVVELRDSSYA